MKDFHLLKWLPVVGLILAGIGWGVSWEVRWSHVQEALQLNDRVSNLERMMFPVLVESEVRKRMHTMTEHPHMPADEMSVIEIEPRQEYVEELEMIEQSAQDDVRQELESWKK